MPDTGSAPPIVQRDDALLRATVLRIANPERVAGLIDTLPADGSLPTGIHGAYEIFKRDQENRQRVFCTHCRARRHWKGVVLEYPNGSRVLIGNVCARKYYGTDFTTLEHSFNELRSRQYYLARFDQLVGGGGFAEAITAISFIESSRHLDRARDARVALHMNLPALFSAVMGAMHHGGELKIIERVRDRRAEERRNDETDKSPIYKSQERTIGRLQGTEFLQPFGRPGSALRNLRGSWEDRFQLWQSMDTNDVESSKASLDVSCACRRPEARR